MLEEQQTVQADPSQDGEGGNTDDAMAQASQASASAPTDPSEEVVKVISKMTGREYSSLEEAEKHLQNLNSLVGNPRIREDASLMERIAKQYAQEKGITESDARRELKSIAEASGTHGDAPKSNIDPALQDKLDRLERQNFALAHPEAQPYLERIADYARATGKSYDDAYASLYADVLKTVAAKQQAEGKRSEKLQAQVGATPAVAAAPDTGRERKALEALRTTGNMEFLAEALKARDTRTRSAKSDE